MLDVLVENMLRQMEGLEPLPAFDGHANCFIESGFEKGILIDFNYEVEPLPGKFPLPGLSDLYPNSFGWVLGVLGIGALIAVVAATLAGLIPAQRSLKLNPIEVIREG
jgi:hypothetical protein